MRATGCILIFISGFLISFDLISQGYMDLDSLISRRYDLHIDVAILILGLIYSIKKEET